MGLDAPSRGSALIDGVPYGELRWPLRSVGAVLEARAFHPGRSACWHLAALAAGGRIPRWRVDEVLGQVGLADVAGRRAGTFSLGMGQRSASRPRCSAIPARCCSTSLSTGSTRPESGGSGT